MAFADADEDPAGIPFAFSGVRLRCAGAASLHVRLAPAEHGWSVIATGADGAPVLSIDGFAPGRWTPLGPAPRRTGATRCSPSSERRWPRRPTGPATRAWPCSAPGQRSRRPTRRHSGATTTWRHWPTPSPPAPSRPTRRSSSSSRRRAAISSEHPRAQRARALAAAGVAGRRGPLGLQAHGRDPPRRGRHRRRAARSSPRSACRSAARRRVGHPGRFGLIDTDGDERSTAALPVALSSGSPSSRCAGGPPRPAGASLPL